MSPGNHHRMKILLTLTGLNDPWSKAPVSGDDQPGPILSLLACREFDKVFLFSTPTVANLTDQTAAAISGPEVFIRTLRITDPTSYPDILRELRRECAPILTENPGAEFFIATASGTPQMLACWFLLAASGEIPATLLQIRPMQYVSKDLPLVTETVPSAPDYPRVLPHRLVAEPTDALSLLDSALQTVGIVVEHPSMKKLAETAAHVAPDDVTVLLLGETGTGKEMFASLIHTLSNRRGRFVPLNCGAIPPELVESSLFGHQKGAFTGATEYQPGYFERAEGGTLFLDEIGDLPLSAQNKFLRVLQDKVIDPVGGGKSRKIDVRIIAATNHDLANEVKEKRFRQDLFYRINPITLRIPPLRDRRSEIARIALFLLASLNRTYRRQRRLSPEAVRRIVASPWPGNVRQLQGVLINAVICSASDLIDAADLQLEVIDSTATLPHPHEGFKLEDFLESVREALINEALADSGGNQSQAARLLGMTSQAVNRFASDLKKAAKTGC
jgi:DNA-binding NtrC family response regulator